MTSIERTEKHKIKIRSHRRHETHSVIEYPTNLNAAQPLQQKEMTVFGRRLNNSLPKYFRDTRSVNTEKFKFDLDQFLKLISYEPKMKNYAIAVRRTTSLISYLIVYD